MTANLAPTMTPILVKAGAFAREPFALVDIGARGGLKPHWRAFGEALRYVGFEPDPDEYRRLAQRSTPQARFMPFGLGGRNETRILYVRENGAGGSLYRDDAAFLDRMMLREVLGTVREQPIELRRLDDLSAELGDVDFVDLDAEGAELEIMRAGSAVLGRTATLGTYVEVYFLEGHNAPLFWETDQFVRGLGYSLYDLVVWRESRRALPYPMCIDQRGADPNVRIFGPTIGGQLAAGDALYLRDALRTGSALGVTKVLKLACLFEIFSQNDSAAELILAHRAEIDPICDHRKLLEALVPVVAGRKLGYDEYMRRYFAHDPLLRSVRPGSDVFHAALRDLAQLAIRGRLARRVAGKIERLIFTKPRNNDT
jgi:FkbM family methyltransferase